MEICALFDPHQIPPKGVQGRCHVLREAERQSLLDYCVSALPECYISTTRLRERVTTTGLSASEVLANTIPDPGSVRSGDFGEIISLYFLGSERVEDVKYIRKWRYKQDRKKATPHSDVVILHRQFEDRPSENDFVICAESKQKATKGVFAPISKAVEGLQLDYTGRLGRTLAWLREKAIDQESLANIKYIERFTHDLSIEFNKQYKAVAIIDRALLDAELTRKPLPKVDGSFEVVIIGISDLKHFYETVFGRAVKEVNV